MHVRMMRVAHATSAPSRGTSSALVRTKHASANKAASAGSGPIGANRLLATIRLNFSRPMKNLANRVSVSLMMGIRIRRRRPTPRGWWSSPRQGRGSIGGISHRSAGRCGRRPFVGRTTVRRFSVQKYGEAEAERLAREAYARLEAEFGAK